MEDAVGPISTVRTPTALARLGGLVTPFLDDTMYINHIGTHARREGRRVRIAIEPGSESSMLYLR